MADVALLRTFLAVFRNGSITRAAAELHLSQPAVSMQVRALEQQLGRSLFTRVARGVTPTPAGMELAQEIAPHVDALETALQPPGRGTDALLDTIYLGGPAEFMTVRVVPALASLVADGMRLRLFFDVDAPIVQRLHEGSIDIAVTTAEWRDRAHETIRLSFEQLVLVASPSMAATIGDVATGLRGADRLEGVPLLAYDEDLPLVADYWREVFGRPPTGRPAAVANSLQSTLQLAISGAGITVVPAHMCDAALRRGDVVPLLVPPAPPRNQLYLAWRAGSLRRRSLAAVHERILTAATDW